MPNTPERDVVKAPTLTDDQWFDEVIRICKERNYAQWFYADRAAWLEDKPEMTPQQAVDYQVECLLF